MIDFGKYSIGELVDIRNGINVYIDRYKDSFVYICKIRSYGSVTTRNLNSMYGVSELCNQYGGDNGIVDVYSTNPDIGSLDNYGEVMYIPSEDDYNRWHEYEGLINLLSDMEGIYARYYDQDEIGKVRDSITNFDMTFSVPVNVVPNGLG